jgi:hypothetical protein
VVEGVSMALKEIKNKDYNIIKELAVKLTQGEDSHIGNDIIKS